MKMLVKRRGAQLLFANLTREDVDFSIAALRAWCAEDRLEIREVRIGDVRSYVVVGPDGPMNVHVYP